MQRITLARTVSLQCRTRFAALCHLCAKSLSLLLCAFTLAATPGCTMLNSTWDEMASWNDKVPWKDSDEDDEVKIPSRITVVWTDSVMSRPGVQPQRGFGGRLMFYENHDEDPIKVDGQLVIYMFDETDRDPENCVPERRIIITADQFKNHYSKSSVGHSYSVWAPWGDVGGHRKQISMVARFEPTDGGGSIMSELTKQLLPGTDPPQIAEKENKSETENTATSPVQQAAFTTGQPGAAVPAVSYEQPQPSMQTTTITIPPSSASVPQVVDNQVALNTIPNLAAVTNPQAASPLGTGTLPGQPANNVGTEENPQAESPEVIDQRKAWETYRQGGWEAYRKLRQTEAFHPTIRPQSSVHSAPRTHQLPAASIAEPRDARAPMRPHPAGWPSGPASKPPADLPSAQGDVMQGLPQHSQQYPPQLPSGQLPGA